jgi:hypothetical protein
MLPCGLTAALPVPLGARCPEEVPDGRDRLDTLKKPALPTGRIGGLRQPLALPLGWGALAPTSAPLCRSNPSFHVERGCMLQRGTVLVPRRDRVSMASKLDVQRSTWKIHRSHRFAWRCKFTTVLPYKPPRLVARCTPRECLAFIKECPLSCRYQRHAQDCPRPRPPGPRVQHFGGLRLAWPRPRRLWPRPPLALPPRGGFPLLAHRCAAASRR